jgi:hypothetical protein
MTADPHPTEPMARLNDALRAERFGTTTKPRRRRRSTPCRRFVLIRHHDISGVSGTGVVAEGILFRDGAVALHWLGDHPSTTAWPSLDDVLAVHGHSGATVIRWLDGPR